jgi:hypothetical protein
MMNSLETEVLELIGESTTSPDVFTDDATGMAQIRDSLNDAIEEISMLSGSVSRTYPMLLRSGQAFYRMDFKAGRFAWVTDAWLISPKRRLEQTDLIKVTAHNPRWLKNSGNPNAYGQIGPDVFFVWPCPSAELICELNCVVIPERYVEDYDRVRLRSMFHHAAVRFAVGEYYASRGDAQQAVYHHNKYIEGMQAMGLYPKSYERPYYFRTEKNREAVTG